jgi:hypothetical protein
LEILKMRRWLIAMVLFALALSGCVEKGPSSEQIKTLAVKSADNLSSYSMESSVNQSLMIGGAAEANATANLTRIMESFKTAASVDLAAYKIKVVGSTRSDVEVPGKAANTTSSQVTIYQIGNSTYAREDDGSWTHLQDPRPAEKIWGAGSNNQVKALAESINQSSLEIVGSERIDGQDCYKVRLKTGASELYDIYNIAFSVAIKLVEYPPLVPSLNSTELNESAKIEKLAWIAKDSYLIRRYQNMMSFKMTPILIGSLDPATGQMKKFNQSIRLGETDVSIETVDRFYDFNQTMQIVPPEEALKALSLSPSSTSAAIAV